MNLIPRRPISAKTFFICRQCFLTAHKSCFNPWKSSCNALRLGVYTSLPGYHERQHYRRSDYGLLDEMKQPCANVTCKWQAVSSPDLIFKAFDRTLGVKSLCCLSSSHPILLVLSKIWDKNLKNRRVKQDIQCLLVLRGYSTRRRTITRPITHAN